MEFCPKCGGLLLPKTGSKKKQLVCKCGYKTKFRGSICIKDEVVLEKKDKIEVVDKKVNTLPKTNEICPICSHDTAYYWSVQTRAGDEAETRFFECVKCKHRWRSYS